MLIHSMDIIIALPDKSIIMVGCSDELIMTFTVIRRDSEELSQYLYQIVLIFN